MQHNLELAQQISEILHTGRMNVMNEYRELHNARQSNNIRYNINATHMNMQKLNTVYASVLRIFQ